MSIPAAESWDVVREAALAFRQWRQRLFAGQPDKPIAGADRDVRREDSADRHMR